MSSWMFLWNLFTFVYQTTGIGSERWQAETLWQIVEWSGWFTKTNVYTCILYTYIYINLIIYKSMKSIHMCIYIYIHLYIHNIPVISHPSIQPSTLPAPVTPERVWIGDNVWRSPTWSVLRRLFFLKHVHLDPPWWHSQNQSPLRSRSLKKYIFIDFLELMFFFVSW